MKKQAPIVLTALLLLIAFTGCSESGNPVGVQPAEDGFTLAKTEALSEGFARGEIGVWAPSAARLDEPFGEGTVSFDVRAVVGNPEQTAEGFLMYKGSAGQWYRAEIRQMNLSGDGTASFSGPITSSNPALFAPTWIYVRVHDGGFPGPGRDGFIYQVAPPDADPDGLLPNEQGIALTVFEGDIVVASGGSFAETK